MPDERPIHVLHVTRLPISVTAFLLPLRWEHRARGERAAVACSDGPEVPAIEAEGFPVHRIRLRRSLRPLNLIRGLAELSRVILKRRVDWVFTHTPVASGNPRPGMLPRPVALVSDGSDNGVVPKRATRTNDPLAMKARPAGPAHSKPTIAHIITARSSVRTIMQPKLRGLARRGYRQLVIAGDDGDPPAMPPGATLVSVPIPRAIAPAGDLRALWCITAILRRHRPDIVHTRTAKAGFLGRVAARLAGVPVVVHTTHGLPFYDGQPRAAYHLYKVLEQLAGRLSDYVLSQNRMDCLRLIQEHVVPATRAGWEGNGVDIAALQAPRDPQIRLRLRREFGASPDQVLCVTVARLEPVKRVGRLIEALARASAPGLKVVVCGEGPELGSLKGLAARCGVQEKLVFAGWRDDVWDVLAAADLVCLTSDKEGLPRSLMESMALGRPAVATNVPGTNEVVADGVTGVLVKQDDVAGLAAALDRLSADRELRQRMGATGAKRAARSFNEEDVLDRLELVYKQLRAGILPTLEPPR